MLIGRRIAQVACGTAVAMALATLWLHWVNREVDLTGLPSRLWPGTVLQTLTWAVAGILIVSQRPRNPFGWLFSAASLAVAVTALGHEYAVYALAPPGHELPAGEWVLWLASWSWVLYVGVIPVLLLVFPHGKLLSRRWAPVLALTATATSALLLSRVLRPGSMVGEPSVLSAVSNPVGIAGWGPALTGAEVAAKWLLDIVLVIGVGSLLIRFRRVHGDERLQLKWLASVAVFLPVTIAIEYLVPGTASTLASKVHMALLIGTITVAVLKHRLYDIDIIINRSLVYGSLTVLVLAIYGAVIAVLGAVLQARAGLVPSLVATAVVAAAFGPLRDRLQLAVNRMLYGGSHEPYEVLSRLGRRLEATVAVDQVLPSIVETVAQALKLPYVAIELHRTGAPDGVHTAVAHGRVRPAALRLPLHYQGEPVGQLVLATRSGEDGFTTADRRLLEDLARQAGVAAHAVALTAALQSSRERLVAAREEERRRLRRDLHDGLGPSLTAVALRIDAARNVLATEPGAADALLAQLRAEVKGAIGSIRRLVYDLRPPALDELGLVSALREQAAGFVRTGNGSVDGLRVSVVAPDELPPLPAAVEVAAYRIGAEAVTNVARHANAGHCLLRLSLNGGLEVEVTDDGVGAAASWRPGIGLASMRERTAELGGTFTVQPGADGGTRVHAHLPLRGR